MAEKAQTGQRDSERVVLRWTQEMISLLLDTFQRLVNVSLPFNCNLQEPENMTEDKKNLKSSAWNKLAAELSRTYPEVNSEKAQSKFKTLKKAYKGNQM